MVAWIVDCVTAGLTAPGVRTRFGRMMPPASTASPRAVVVARVDVAALACAAADAFVDVDGAACCVADTPAGDAGTATVDVDSARHAEVLATTASAMARVRNTGRRSTRISETTDAKAAPLS